MPFPPFPINLPEPADYAVPIHDARSTNLLAALEAAHQQLEKSSRQTTESPASRQAAAHAYLIARLTESIRIRQMVRSAFWVERELEERPSAEDLERVWQVVRTDVQTAMRAALEATRQHQRYTIQREDCGWSPVELAAVCLEPLLEELTVAGRVETLTSVLVSLLEELPERVRRAERERRADEGLGRQERYFEAQGYGSGSAAVTRAKAADDYPPPSYVR